MTIKTKLFVFILGSFIIGVSGSSYWNYRQTEQAVLEILKSKQKEGAFLAAQNLQRTMDRLQYALVELADNSFVLNVLRNQGDKATVQYGNEHLAVIRKEIPEIAVVAVVNARGLVAASCSPEAVGKVNIGDRDYFKKAMQGERALSKPAQSRTTGKPAVMIAAPVRDGGVIRGAVYITIDLEKVFADVAALKSGTHGYAFILDATGTMLYHPDKSRIFVDTRKEEWAAPLWKGGKEGYFECDFAGSVWLVNYNTMPDTGWIVLLNAEDTDLLTSIINIRNKTVLINGVLFVVVALLVWLVVRALGKALNQGVAFAKRVEAGDFEARWNANTRDELGTLAASLNTAFDKVTDQTVWFRNVLNAIKTPIAVMDSDGKITYVNEAFIAMSGRSEEELLGNPCSVLKTEICETENCGIRCLERGVNSTRFRKNGRGFEVSMYHMLDKDRHSIGYIEVLNDVTEQEELKARAAEAVLQGKLNAARELESVVEIISSASAELSAQIERSERGAVEQAARVNETATAMEEMSSTVVEVARNAGETSDLSVRTRDKANSGASIVRKAVSSIRQVQQESLALREDMRVLAEQAQAINRIMGVISDIADQTNLLALNAAIEAARAGEAGRGFAVVADEVRKLAEKTMASTTDVGNAIQAIQDSTTKSMEQVDKSAGAIEEATDFANQSGDALKEIVTMSDSTADQVRAIATAAEQQSASSEEISRSIAQINTIADGTAQAMREAARAVSDLTAQSRTLIGLIEDMKQG